MNEGKRRSAAVNESSFAGRIKRLRRAYLLSLIFFITNNDCNFPFHIVLSDTVESCGGSTELMKILNRLCVIASTETLKRTIQCVTEKKLE